MMHRDGEKRNIDVDVVVRIKFSIESEVALCPCRFLDLFGSGICALRP